MTTYRIKQWNDVFEDFRSRQVGRLRFLPFDLTRNSEAYQGLVASDRGIAAYGVFWALVLVAARCPVRGVLSDEKGPFTVRRLAVRTRMSEEAINDAIQILTDQEIGWLEVVACENQTTSNDATAMPETETPTAQRPRNVQPATADPPNNVGATSVLPQHSDAATSPRARAQNTNRTGQDRTKQKSNSYLPAMDENAMRADLDAAIDRIPNSELEHALKHYPNWPSRPAFAYDAASIAVNLIAERDDISWREALAWLGERIRAYAVAKKGSAFILAPDKWLKGQCYDENEANWKERGNGRDQSSGGAGVSAGATKRGTTTHEAAESRRSDRARNEYPEPNGTGGVRVA